MALFFSLVAACAEPDGSGDASSEEAGDTTATTESGDTDTASGSDVGDADPASDTTVGDGSADDGTPVDDNPADDCDGSWSFGLKPDPSQVASFMLVVDRSGSMTEAGRWTSMFSALTGVTDTLDGMVDFGLMLFPAPGLAACAPGTVSVEPAPNSASAIRAALETWDPLGGTPTALAIEEAGDWLMASNPSGSNYILLATDGGPGCNSGLDPNTCECIPGANCECPFGGSLCEMAAQNCLDSVRTANAVLTQRERGINTFVVGIPGSEVVADLLDTMAVAGGTAVNGQHYAVTNESELIEALSSASGSTIPCEFPMETVPADLASLQVTLDGQPVSRDETQMSGWDVVDGKLKLYGSTCATMRNGLPHELHVQFDCD